MDVLNDLQAEEDLLLELLNTTPVLDGVRNDQLAGADDGAAWVREHGGRGDPDEVSAVRRTRDRLQSAVRGEGPIEQLDELVRQVTLTPRIRQDGRPAWRVGPDDRPALDTRVLLGWLSIASSRPDRLRACANDDCRLFLLDRSKSGTAKWCSMATCGNRLKARRFVAKTSAR